MYRNLLWTITLFAFAGAVCGQGLTDRRASDRETVAVSFEDRRETMELEEFSLWAPNGTVVIHEPSGVREVQPSPARYFRVRSANDRDVLGFLAVNERSDHGSGILVRGERHFRLTAALGKDRGASSRPVPVTAITAVADSDDWNDRAASWRCALDGARLPRNSGRQAPASNDRPGAATAISSSQSYALSLEVETDYELYLAFNDVNAVQAYVTSLTGALATIYQRDIQTAVAINHIHVYPTADLSPWHAEPSQGVQAALYEVGDYYHAHPVSNASAVVLLSGKAFNSGTGWEGSLCGGEFACSGGNCGDPAADGHYGGPYAVCGSIWSGSVPALSSDWLPNVDYWVLQDYAHELGHVIGGHHTNCILLPSGEQTVYQRQFVDQCYSDEYQCFAGPTSTPSEGGTIMSACFNMFYNSFPLSRYVLGKAGEPSHHELDDYLLRSQGPLAGGKNVVSSTGTLAMSSIAAASPIVAGSAGNSASISPVSGATYAWSISNGTITAGANSSSMTFTAGASGNVVVTAYLYNASGCAGITESQSIATTSALPAPTGLVAWAASGTSVNLAWQPVAGTNVYYKIYRTTSTNHTVFSAVPGGCTTQAGTQNSPYVDGYNLAPDNAYLYQVKAASGSPACSGQTIESPASNSDFATTSIFTHTITNLTPTQILASDVVSLRTAVNALYKLAYDGAAYSFADPTILSCSQFPGQCTPLKAVHVNDLRAAVNAARQQLIGPQGQLTFTDPTLLSCAQNPTHCTPIRAIHFNELRAAVQ